ncbi:hypothetical protein Moror_14948 [Moniliophthora roreri MCA 2997]|uniref:Uncharacterized protein n=2 Tax=Moniliophthora roreri TaxID=221103 RepID=V2XZN0_MONRO|nr:hypothetical protein Moror_14948 [Moniliophthora roreri MCA 2997]KAI3621575.1 hypothetical protein WG66_000376 [Moniliophthora roreri]
MSIRTVQTRYKASSSPSTVLTTIDTNSPPSPLPGLAAKVLYLNMTTPPRSTSPKPLSASNSTLSPLASPYKPKLSRSSSFSHTQNQHLHQQSQRVGARAGRGIPATPVDPSSMSFVGASSGIVDPMFGGLPTYHSTSRFDPFGDFTVSETSYNQYLSSPQPLLQSPPSSPTSGVTSFAFNVTINPSVVTQPLASGTGANIKPAYNHYYYYDTTTNSPTLAYGSPPISSSQNNNNNNRLSHNRNRSNSNHRARNNGNHHNSTNHHNNTYNQGRRANSVVNSFNHSRPTSRSPSPPSPLTSPTKASFSSPSTVAFPSQGSVIQDPFADPVVTAPVESVPIRTRKRSNTISEPSRSPSPPSPVPSRSPSPPSTAAASPAPVDIVDQKETVKLEQPVAKLSTKKDNSAISKLVAAMLLNRVDAMGRSRCGKRVTSCGTGYVKSSLSRVVFVE